MTDQGNSKEYKQQFIAVGSLKEIAESSKRFLKLGRKQLKFNAKVVALANNSG